MGLVDHARNEIELIETDQEFIEMIVKVVEAFCTYGHSGGSASVAIPIINELLLGRTLSPLTNDQKEWVYYTEDMFGVDGGVWQNCRNCEAFSNDGGKTYYLLSEGGTFTNPGKIHVSNTIGVGYND